MSSEKDRTFNLTKSELEVAKDRQPWRYTGFPGLAKWMSSDRDFFIVRQFGNLGARYILLLQNRICKLEEELAALDEQAIIDCKNSGTLRDLSDKRVSLIRQIGVELHSYNTFVLSHSQVKAAEPPDAHQLRNIDNWLWNNRGAIVSPEDSFIQASDGLFTLSPRKRMPLRRFLDRFDWFFELSIFRAKPSPNSGLDEENTYLNKDALIDKVLNFTILSIGLGMFLGPLWALQLAIDMGCEVQVLLGIISGCIVLLVILLSAATLAQPFEVLAATAAYSAVLMIYMQIAPVSQKE